MNATDIAGKIQGYQQECRNHVERTERIICATGIPLLNKGMPTRGTTTP